MGFSKSRNLRRLAQLSLAVVLAQHEAARDADAEHVEPALGEIEKVGIKQRAEEILRNDADADPGRVPRNEEYAKMRRPHGKQQHDAGKPERNAGRQDLIMGIGCSGRRRWVRRRTFGKQGPRGAGAVTEDGRFTHDFQGHFPEADAGAG